MPYITHPTQMILLSNQVSGIPETNTRRANDNKVTIVVVPGLMALYSLLLEPRFAADLLCVDINGFDGIDTAEIFDLITALSTVVKFSSSPGTKICVGATVDISPNRRRELTKHTACIGIYPLGDGFTSQEKLEAISQLAAGQRHIPKRLTQAPQPVRAQNSIRLTSRQSQILAIIRERGVCNKTIARMLGITEHTVKSHITAILRQYGAKNRTQLVLFAAQAHTQIKNSEVLPTKKCDDSTKITE